MIRSLSIIHIGKLADSILTIDWALSMILVVIIFTKTIVDNIVIINTYRRRTNTVGMANSTQEMIRDDNGMADAVFLDWLLISALISTENYCRSFDTWLIELHFQARIINEECFQCSKNLFWWHADAVGNSILETIKRKLINIFILICKTEVLFWCRKARRDIRKAILVKW